MDKHAEDVAAVRTVSHSPRKALALLCACMFTHLTVTSAWGAAVTTASLLQTGKPRHTVV